MSNINIISPDTGRPVLSTKDICNTTTDVPTNDTDNIEQSTFINKLKRKNYTPFGMEFKRIWSTYLYDYGMWWRYFELCMVFSYI